MILCISALSVIISPFSFLILLIWGLSLFWGMSLNKICQFRLSSQRTSFLALLIFATVSFIYFSLIFIISFPLLFFFLVCLATKSGCWFDIFLIFWARLVLPWTSLLELLLLHPLGFGLSCFYCRLFPCIFYFSFNIFSELLVIQNCVV